MADQEHDSIWASGGAADADLFKGETPKEVVAGDLFTVPYEPRPQELTGSPQSGTGEAQPEPLPFPAEWAEPRSSRWISLQSALVAAITVVSFLLLYGLFLAPPPTKSVAQGPPADGPVPAAEKGPQVPAVAPSPGPSQEKVAAEVPAVHDSSEPASRQVAESYFSRMDFDKAAVVYQRLHQRLSSDPANEAAQNFLVWRMALCAKGQGHLTQAVTLLRQPANSRFPVMRALARYHLGLIAIQQQQYLEAAGEIYQALALVDALQGQETWSEAFKRNCRFLIAKAVTLEALSLRETQEEWPASLWATPSVPDLWGQLDDARWSQILQSDTEGFGEVSLRPCVEAGTDAQGTGTLWKVISNGAPLEEVLLRLAAEAKLELTWSATTVSGTSTVDPVARQRPLFVYMRGATTQEALTQAAGAARLSVRVDPSGTTVLIDPLHYHSLGEHIADLRQQAMSLWYQLRLIYRDQTMVPTTHFALGLLYEQNDQVSNAVAEYGLLVSRFPQSDLAPQALLRSSRLHMGLRDYAGARQDLSQLVGQYPEAASSGQALLALADATMKAGLADEAVRLYAKAFHTEGTTESRRTAAFRAGQCLYGQREYEQALRWLTRYLDLSPKTGDQGQETVHVLLGKTYLALGQFAPAAEAFQRALQEPLSRSDYVQALSSLVQARIGQDDCVGALNALDQEHPRFLTARDRTDFSILKAQVLCSMGLAERAIGLLEEGLGSVSDPNQKAQVCLRLAQCHQGLDQWEPARRYFSKVLEIGAPGPLAQQASLELAAMSLTSGQPDQAIAFCRQVLDAHPAEAMRQRASDLLASAYADRREFGKAAESLLPVPADRKGQSAHPTSETHRSSEGVTRAEG